MAEDSVVDTSIDESSYTDGEKIFVPRDIDKDRDPSDFREYKYYKLKFWTVVPPKCVLVTKNVFTGKIKSSKGSGWKFRLPLFTKRIIVSVADSFIDYPRMDFKTSDGINATLNLTLKVNISDPVKYMETGKQQLGQLARDVQTLLGDYANSHTFDEINSKRVLSVDDFDDKGILDKYYDKYGINISQVQFQQVEMPKELKEAEQKKRAAKALYEAKMFELETLKKTKEVEAAALANKINLIVTELTKAGFSKEYIDRQVQTLIASEGNNAHVILGAGGVNSPLATMMALAPDKTADTSKSVDTGASKTVDTDISKPVDTPKNGAISKEEVYALLNAILKMVQFGGLSDTSKSDYLNLYQSIESDINHFISVCSREKYDALLSQINSGTFSLSGGRGRK